MERLQELINANPKTHPTDCVSRATKQQLDRFVSVRARFENLMDGQKEREGKREKKKIRETNGRKFWDSERFAINNIPKEKRRERKREREKERKIAVRANFVRIITVLEVKLFE